MECSWDQLGWVGVRCAGVSPPKLLPPPTSSLGPSVRERQPCAEQRIHLSQNPHSSINPCLWSLRGLNLDCLLATEWVGYLMMSRENVRALPEIHTALTGSWREEQRVNSVPHSLESLFPDWDSLCLYFMLGSKKTGFGRLRGAKKVKCLLYSPL